jgi:predicted lipoprotein with Yx(FWY)xxD motif
MKRSVLLAAATLLLAGAQAHAASAPVSQTNTAKGEILTDATGKTLYTFDKDKNGMSSCYGGCATNWPPFLAAAGATPSGPYTLVARKDGGEQWAYHGMPLYYWHGDSATGQTNGDGIKDVWHVVPYGQASTTGISTGKSW